MLVEAEMNVLVCAALVGLVLVLSGAGAQVNVLQPPCDSPEAEEAALLVQDHLNAQHKHGYKYVLNRIEDIKIYAQADGNSTYLLELELLETECHVLDPTPVSNCSVRPKILTAVEGDCDVVLKKVSGALRVTDYKCKTEESREDDCVGCHSLLPLNHTSALDFVHVSLETLNNRTENGTFLLHEVGRMSSQVVSGGPAYTAEYVVVEGNCTDGACVPLNDVTAVRGFCTARGSNLQHTVDCKMFPSLVPSADANSTTAAVVHTQNGNLTHAHGPGLRHHKLPSAHGPEFISLFSSESDESNEMLPVAAPSGVQPKAAPTGVPAAAAAAAAAAPTGVPEVTAAGPDPAPMASDSSSAADGPQSKDIVIEFKRDLSAVLGAVFPNVPETVSGPGVNLMPVCPGRVRFF